MYELRILKYVERTVECSVGGLENFTDWNGFVLVRNPINPAILSKYLHHGTHYGSLYALQNS